jgi:hypothetical protein
VAKMLQQAEVFEPKVHKVMTKLSDTQHRALYAYSERTGIPMAKLLRDGAMNIVEAAEATLVP